MTARELLDTSTWSSCVGYHRLPASTCTRTFYTLPTSNLHNTNNCSFLTSFEFLPSLPRYHPPTPSPLHPSPLYLIRFLPLSFSATGYPGRHCDYHTRLAAVTTFLGFSIAAVKKNHARPPPIPRTTRSTLPDPLPPHLSPWPHDYHLPALRVAGPPPRTLYPCSPCRRAALLRPRT